MFDKICICYQQDDHLVNVISLKEEVDELENLIKKGANPVGSNTNKFYSV